MTRWVRRLGFFLVFTTFTPTVSVAADPAAPKKTVRELLHDLRGDDDNSRVAAAQLLGDNKADKRDVLPALAEAAKDPLGPVRIAAAGSLGKMGNDAVPDLCDLLADEHRAVRAAAAGSLERLGEAAPAIPCLVRSLQEELRDDDAGFVEDALIGIGKDVAPFMLAALKDKDPKLRRSALRVLIEIPKEAWDRLPTLIAALTDDDPMVRLRAAEGLGNLTGHDEIIVPALAAAIRKEQAPMVRRGTMRALSRFGSKAAPVLTAALADDRRDVRRSAATYLGQMGYAGWEALPSLGRCVNDPDRWVRSAALDAIEEIQTNNHGSGSSR